MYQSEFHISVAPLTYVTHQVNIEHFRPKMTQVPDHLDLIRMSYSIILERLWQSLLQCKNMKLLISLS